MSGCVGESEVRGGAGEDGDCLGDIMAAPLDLLSDNG